MDDYLVNERAVVQAYDLIERRHYVIGTTWPQDHPTLDQQEAFIRTHTWQAFALWHLAIAPDSPEQTIARYQFAYGDFTRLHRAALVDCLARAQRGGHRLLEEACSELLHRLDAKAGIPDLDLPDLPR